MKIDSYIQATALLDTFLTTTIKGYYSDTLPVPAVCVEAAKRLIKGTINLGIGLPTSILQCDGVVLRYDDDYFSLDIDHDGEIMIFGPAGQVYYDGVDIDQAIYIIDTKVFPC